MGEHLLEIKGLKTHFATDDGWIHAVDGVDITIDRGETVAAIYHALGSAQKELRSYPCSHSVHPLDRQWDEFFAYSRAWARQLLQPR